MLEEFKPGDTVPKSGIYKVTHDEHSAPHEVTCVEGEPFPPCSTCKHPRFVLVRAAHHIKNHEHFNKKGKGEGPDWGKGKGKGEEPE